MQLRNFREEVFSLKCALRIFKCKILDDVRKDIFGHREKERKKFPLPKIDR